MSNTLRDDDLSNPSTHAHLHDIVERAVALQPSRRRLLQAGLGAAAVPFLSGMTAVSTAVAATAKAAAPAERMLGFEAVGASSADTVVVPAGYRAVPMLPWGEPIDARAPAFKPDATNTAAEQERQMGDNHDAIEFFGFNAARTGFGDRSDEGLLVMNHEYINPEYFYAPDSDAGNWMKPFTAEKARKGQAAHGVSVVHVKRNAKGEWEHVKASRFNRRIHGNSPVSLQGPAAGQPLMRTAADPEGRSARGTLNNCGGGRTPWGTYLTCEENFNGYFGWNGERKPTALESRYGLSKDGFGYQWHTADARFDLNATPNEPNRFGWVVEIDPFNPDALPVKRTSLGRFKHENAELVIAPNGQVVVYMGCDERNEYLYKFVSAGRFDSRNPQSAYNRELLSEGTLYAAKLDAGGVAGDRMGGGTWIPLVYGQHGLTEANGFQDQGDVLLRARQAADRVGATMMDRPEWVAANPRKPGEVYLTLTNNNRRGTDAPSSNQADGSTTAGSAKPVVDEANPRPNNVWGHILRWNEGGGDATARSFTWDLFVLAGQPSVAGARAPSANINAGNIFNSPDGLAFDRYGRMWIQSDGNYSNTGEYAGMGNNQMLVADPASGEIRRFLVGPSGCEITGVTFTPDRRTVFVNVQHPGELGNHPNAPKRADGKVFSDNDIARDPTRFSQWPVKGMRPRAATVAISRIDGGPVGG